MRGERLNPEMKLHIIQEGQRLGVQKTCEKHGISRTLYYRWLKRYETKGLQGLEVISRSFVPPHKIPKATEQQVLEAIRQFPEYGPRELKYQLEARQLWLSESAVYNIMRRNALSRREDRLTYSQKRKFEKAESELDTSQFISGQCWLFWITHYGHFDNLGDLYEYTIMDLVSRIACSRLYTKLHVDSVADLVAAVALPIAQSLSFDTRHLYFIDQLDELKAFKTKLPQQIHRLVQNVGFELDMQFLKKNEVPALCYQLRSEYTKGCLGHLLPFLNQGESLQTVRYHLQTYIRAYNLTLPMLLSESGVAPMTFHTETTHQRMVLPLWAYIERDY